MGHERTNGLWKICSDIEPNLVNFRKTKIVKERERGVFKTITIFYFQTAVNIFPSKMSSWKRPGGYDQKGMEGVKNLAFLIDNLRYIFLKMGQPRHLFHFYYHLFKHTLQFLQQINVNNVHPV